VNIIAFIDPTATHPHSPTLLQAPVVIAVNCSFFRTFQLINFTLDSKQKNICFYTISNRRRGMKGRARIWTMWLVSAPSTSRSRVLTRSSLLSEFFRAALLACTLRTTSVKAATISWSLADHSSVLPPTDLTYE
jgi:hypothetical protein